jgi:hypothetical protein
MLSVVSPDARGSGRYQDAVKYFDQPARPRSDAPRRKPCFSSRLRRKISPWKGGCPVVLLGGAGRLRLSFPLLPYFSHRAAGETLVLVEDLAARRRW